MQVAIRAGDNVFHRPTRERWYVLGINAKQGKVCVAGWPPTIADISDCVLEDRGGGISADERKYRESKFGVDWDD